MKVSELYIDPNGTKNQNMVKYPKKKKKNFGLRQEADHMNEVYVRSTPRPMSTRQRNRGIQLLPPFESIHYSHK